MMTQPRTCLRHSLFIRWRVRVDSLHTPQKRVSMLSQCAYNAFKDLNLPSHALLALNTLTTKFSLYKQCKIKLVLLLRTGIASLHVAVAVTQRVQQFVSLHHGLALEFKTVEFSLLLFANPPPPPRCNFSSTLYPQSCWCIIQAIHSP
jgi:hypothetical protein